MYSISVITRGRHWPEVMEAALTVLEALDLDMELLPSHGW